ncbi:carboxypeptidase-like regulatory domain-containing protein, partial [uncultured Duncaniella sp.]
MAVLCLTLFTAFTLSAAEPKITVSGTVTLQSDGEPLTGVSVRLKGTSQGVATDIDGNYSLPASKGDVL